MFAMVDDCLNNDLYAHEVLPIVSKDMIA